MNKLRIAYFGSPPFSATLLESLLSDSSLPVEIAFVVTQPDKPVGKKHIITPSPVKIIAEKYKIPCWDKKLNEAANIPAVGKKSDGEVRLFDLLKEVDLALVFAYGFKELIPLDLLGAPKFHFDIGEGRHSGFINIHPSLLPLYRGSSPIAYPILLGDSETGVSLFVMDEKMDHGPVVAQEKTAVLDDKRPAMETLLTETGAKMAKKLLTDLAAGKQPELAVQDHAKATRAPYMVKDDGFVSFEVLKKALKNEPLTLQELPQILQKYADKYYSAIGGGGGRAPGDAQSKDIHLSEHQREGNLRQNLLHYSSMTFYNFWLGMYPWPGVWTIVKVNGQEKRLKLNEMKLDNDSLTLTKVQLEGKNEVDFATFQKAYGLF